MDQRSTIDLLYVAAFFLGGLGFAVGPFIIATLFSPRGTRNLAKKTNQLIECGMPPIGDAWIRYGIIYYLYALIFLAFDVDVLFLFPVAMAYSKAAPVSGFIEVVLFVAILTLALVYAWNKGVFEWKRKNYNRQ
ncbi:MAG: NADH-quinone oxidoreductase subunit A [Proteobacteria bacterium]|nr:NADH-quinone oxidoreductase subunit A [Desulfobulbaceae bacterium]MBU4151986.1 NADH-quinone oxidoreductase subunit A [Pseudomonadota bacterium]MDP2104677.1 NADH-quinone oxidoreductase subunit A [Desulfobulbaceae bacterium]